MRVSVWEGTAREWLGAMLRCAHRLRLLEAHALLLERFSDAVSHVLRGAGRCIAGVPSRGAGRWSRPRLGKPALAVRKVGGPAEAQQRQQDEQRQRLAEREALLARSAIASRSLSRRHAGLGAGSRGLSLRRRHVDLWTEWLRCSRDARQLSACVVLAAGEKKLGEGGV